MWQRFVEETQLEVDVLSAEGQSPEKGGGEKAPVKVTEETAGADESNGCEEITSDGIKCSEEAGNPTPNESIGSSSSIEAVEDEKEPEVVSKNESEEINSNPHLIELLEMGLDERVAKRLCRVLNTSKLVLTDLDKRALDALKEYGNPDGAISVLDEFEVSDLDHVANKSAFLCGLMKSHRQKEKKQQQKTSSPVPHPGPNEAKLKEILERTGYTLDVTSGQRKYGGPPPEWDGPTPEAGCEIFVGKIPKDMFEDELIPIFEEAGRIWDLRIMIDPLTGTNRGYAFITYCDKDEAKAAQLKVGTLSRCPQLIT